MGSPHVTQEGAGRADTASGRGMEASRRQQGCSPGCALRDALWEVLSACQLRGVNNVALGAGSAPFTAGDRSLPARLVARPEPGRREGAARPACPTGPRPAPERATRGARRQGKIKKCLSRRVSESSGEITYGWGAGEKEKQRQTDRQTATAQGAWLTPGEPDELRSLLLAPGQ